MARKIESLQSRSEILEIERAADARRQSRDIGFSKMKERDFGTAILSNNARITWPVEAVNFPEEDIWVYPKYIPEGYFELEIHGKRTLFDAEEFRKWLRWV